MNALDRIDQDVAESLASDSQAPLARDPILADLSWMLQRNRHGEELITKSRNIAAERQRKIASLERDLRKTQRHNEVHGIHIQSLCTQFKHVRAVLDKAGCAEVGGDVETRTSRRVEQLAKERSAAADIITEAHRKLDELGAPRASTLAKRLAALNL